MDAVQIIGYFVIGVDKTYVDRKIGHFLHPIRNDLVEKYSLESLTINLAWTERCMDHEIICYCFNYTELDIKKDFTENRHSTIMDRIISEKKDGNCKCETTNPKGR